MSERDEAERDGADLHRNSGRGWIQKGDASLGELCIDYKEYTESFSVSRRVWAKVTSDALRMRKIPALKLVLGKKNIEAAPVTVLDSQKLRLWVIPDDFFHEMYGAWQQIYGEDT